MTCDCYNNPFVKLSNGILIIMSAIKKSYIIEIW